MGELHQWIDAALGLGSIASILGSVYVARHLARGDSLQETVQEHGERIAKLEGRLETGYWSPTR